MIIKELRDETITLPVADYARLLTLAVDHEKVTERVKCLQTKIVRMREQLTAYQRMRERLKAARKEAK